MYTKKDIHFSRIIFFIFKIFGLAPFSMNISEGQKQSTIKFGCSTIGNIYNISLSLVLLFLGFIATNHVVQKRKPEDGNIIVAFRVAFIWLSNVFFTLILMIHCFKQKSLTMLINKVICLDNKLVTHWNDRNSLQSHKYIGVLIFATNALLHIITRVLLIISSDIEIVFFMGPAIPNFGIACFTIQYTSTLIFLMSRFHCLNELLSSLKNPVDNHIELQNIPIYVTSARGTNIIAIKDLLVIRVGRQILSEVSENFSNLCRWPILLSIIITSVNLIFNTYTCMLRLLSSPHSSTEILTIVNDIAAITTNIFPTIVLTYYGTSIIEETERTGNIVHKVMTSYKSEIAMKSELQELSDELLHRKISFTAGGFLPINFNLLQMMISTTITYMIILLQQN